MKINVATSSPYSIVIERGCLQKAGELSAELFSPGARAAVVSDSNVLPIYGDAVVTSLRGAGFQVSAFSFPAGEESKRLSKIEKMVSFFVECGLTRSDFVVALGGGVTGDMAGFAAATWLRGIRFVQIPTSLLAQIDSSVGGKTGVDLPQGKNLVGAFHQPSLVLIDPDTLHTLPEAFFADGMGEAIKYGCIFDRPLLESIRDTDIRNHIEPMIAHCVDWKRQVVERDELDNGDRMLLNFGHTFGHALEKLHSYHGLTHGAAVGIGMVLMSRLGEAAGLTKPGTAEEIASVLQKYGLPVSDDIETDRLLEATLTDKKGRGDEITLILLREIGGGFLHRVSRETFQKLAEAL